MGERQNLVSRLKRCLRDWRAAAIAPSERRSRALKVLDALEELAGSNSFTSLDRKTAHEVLDETGKRLFLVGLGETPDLERWAEAAFKLIQASGFSLLDLFKARVKARPARVLFQDMSAPVPLQWTYEQIDRRTREIAAAFYRLSSGPAGVPRVAIFSENTVDSAAADLACLFYDILDTPLNTHFDQETLVHIFDRLAIDIAVVDRRERGQVLEEVRARTAVPFRIVTLDRDAVHESDHTVFLGEYCGGLSAAEVERVLARRRRRPLNEVATVMFTSGSTGKAKGVSFSTYQLVAKRFARAAALPEVGDDEVFLSFLPLYHTFGRYLEMLGAIYWGGTYVFPGNPSVDTLLSLLPRVNPTGFISVPVRWAQLHEKCLERIDAAGPSADTGAVMRSVVGRRMRWGLSAAGYLDSMVFRFFERNGVAVSSGFGMTEGTGGITMTPPGRYVDNTHGLPLPGMRVRLGERGELQISGHYVARYLEDKGPGDIIPYPEGPDKDTWLPTGDVFKRLENGYYQIIDRIKDIYKNNRGQTVDPLKVENKFIGVPGIRRSFLVGDGRPHNVLFIVPDRGDSVLGAALTAENEREYYRRIVNAANTDLAPYERVVNFSLLERDFDPGRGEVTPKGSYNRKVVERDFETQIEALYRTNFVEFKADELSVRIPHWFYRDLGILEDDISFDEGGLRDQARSLTLPLRKGDDPSTVLVGDLEYSLRGDVLDLGLFVRQPRLWIGNPALVRFSPCKEGWDVPLEVVSGRVFLPSSRAGVSGPGDIPEPAGIGDGHLKEVHRLVSMAFFGGVAAAAEALEEIERLFVEPELRTSSLLLGRLEALARHPEERIRCAAYRILLLDEPNPEYSKALSAFVQSGLSFLNEESIELIASFRLGKGRFDALRQRMLAYREQMEWPVGDASRLQFERIFRLFTDFCRYHPEYYGNVRAELSSWVLHRSDAALSARAEELLVELDLDSQRLLAGDEPEPASEEWAAKLTFDEGIGSDEAAGIGELLRTRAFLKKSLGLAFDAEGFELKDVPEGGIWISRLPVPNYRGSYRLGVTAAGGRHYDLQLVLDEALGTAAYRETVRWYLTIASYPYGQRVLPPLGCFRPESNAVSIRYPGGLDIWEKIREFAAVRGSEGLPGAPGLWRRLFIEAMSAFFRAWQYSSRRIVPGLVSPANVVVPELDYREEPMISSLGGWKPYEDTLSLVRPMVVNFYLKTGSHYPWSRDQLDLEWIFDACYEALGRREGLEFLDRLRADLAREPVAGPDGKSLAEALDAYLDYFGKNYVIPLPAINAMESYKTWELRNDLAPAKDKEAVLLDVTRLYRLDRYPEVVRYYLYRHTYFAGADEKARTAFDRLLAKMSANLERPAVQFLELSDLQAALRKDEDRLVFSRMVFPRLRGSQALDILKVGEGGGRQVVVHSYLTGCKGEVFTFGETFDPAEIGRLYRLFFQEKYPKKILEQDRHYIVKDGQERVVSGLCYRMMSRNVAFIDVIVVASSLQGGGIGGAMLEDFCGRMSGSGINVILTHSYLPGFFLHRGFKADRKWGALVRYL
jgi:long-subunit acyl-CoA synthetase (AMP-forming)